MIPPQENWRKKGFCFVVGLFLFLLLFPVASRATPILDSWTVQFMAPEQSLWVPGGAIGFNWAGNLPLSFGPFSLNMNINASASSGSVSGNVEGLLGVRYNDHLDAPGNTPIELNFGGLTNESNLTTTLGANFGLAATFGVDLPWWLPDWYGTLSASTSPTMNGDKDFTYQRDYWIDGRAKYEPKIAGLGADIGIAGVEIAPMLYQDFHFKPGAITGELVYSHLGTGTSGSIPFSTADPLWVGMDLPLTLPGYWALAVEDLKLASNSFYTEVGYGVNASAWATLLGSVNWQENIDVYHGGEFPLTFNGVDRLPGSMLVYVGEGHTDSVPEPAPVALLTLGLIALFVVRRCRK